MENYNLTGVYEIRNLITNKIYIGSTTQSFEKRKQQHYYELNKKKHKNSYLQNAWNKYGEENFVFNILEICEKDKCLEREQYYLDTYNSLYNINPLASGTPNMSKETIVKRTKTFTETSRVCLIEYKALKNGEISLENVSKKCIKIVNARINNIIWNKGLTKKDVDYSYLKVPKTNSDKLKASRKAVANLRISKQKPFYVFNHKSELIGYYNNIQEFIKLNPYETLPIISRNEKSKTLSNCNIAKNLAGKTKHHKGLIFSFNNCVEPLTPKDFGNCKSFPI